MTTFNPPPLFFDVPLYLPLLTPKGVKAPTFSGTHVLRGVKIGNFPATLWKRNGIKFWLVHVFPLTLTDQTLLRALYCGLFCNPYRHVWN